MFGENKIFESIDNLFDIIDGDRGKNYPKSDELFSEEYCLPKSFIPLSTRCNLQNP